MQRALTCAVDLCLDQPEAEGRAPSSGIFQGLDGWRFCESTIGIYQQAPELRDRLCQAWRDHLLEQTAWLKGRGIRYIHLTVPDKLALFGEFAGSALPATARSPVQSLVSRYRAELPCLINPADYFRRQKDSYPLFWKSDTRWTPWSCFMANQLICAQLGVEVNKLLLGYPFKEANQPMDLDHGEMPAEPEVIRTYSFQMRSRRRYANELVEFRETTVCDGGKLPLDSGVAGSQVVFENRHPAVAKKTVVLFGDANADYQRHLLTGMLAETFSEVHFVWCAGIDRNYIDRVRPDVVISQNSERHMLTVPEADVETRALAVSSLNSLRESSQEITVDSCSALSGQDVPGTKPRVLLPSETYELKPPRTVQAGCRYDEPDTCMRTNDVVFTQVHGASVYFTGSSWSVTDSAGHDVLRHETDAARKPHRPRLRRRRLKGRTLMFATSAGAHCYYHWMLEILPKLGLLQRESIALESIDHLLVRKITGNWQLETLERFGFRRSRIVETEKQPHMECDSLIHVDINCGINLKMHRFIPLWMKHLFPAEVSGKPRLKLYISRPEGVRRGISNEADFLPLLRKAGFTVMAMEGLSVREQAELMARTDVLMSPHGGALTNMVFCRPGITVIELFSRHVFPYYYGLSANCGHNYYSILENPAEDFPRLVNSRVAQSFADNQHETAGLSFTAPVEAIERVLTQL